MSSIEELLTDQEAIGDRDLPVHTLVDANHCLWLTAGRWKVVRTVCGIIVPLVYATVYPGQEIDDHAYTGPQARIIPSEPYPQGGPHPSLHPITLNLDPYPITVHEGNDTFMVTGRWVLHSVGSLHS